MIAVDALGDGVSSSPSTSPTQPRMTFPKFTIRDMVESQHRLLTGTLQIRHVDTVMGISMGGMQTFEWMTAYPEFMNRAIAIVGSPQLTSMDLLLWTAEKHTMEAGKDWMNGDYRKPPVGDNAGGSRYSSVCAGDTGQARGRDNAGRVREVRGGQRSGDGDGLRRERLDAATGGDAGAGRGAAVRGFARARGASGEGEGAGDRVPAGITW